MVTCLFLTVANSGVLLVCFSFSAKGGESPGGGSVIRMCEVARVRVCHVAPDCCTKVQSTDVDGG